MAAMITETTRWFMVCLLLTAASCKKRTDFLTVLDRGVSGDLPARLDGTKPMFIECDLIVNSIDSINEANMDFTIDLFVRFTRESMQIANMAKTSQFENYSLDLDAQNMDKDFTVDLSVHFTWESMQIANLAKTSQFEYDSLDLDALNMDKVWVPDIYFPNEKKAEVHNILMSNKMLRIFKSGLVSYILRVQVTLSCRMDLRKYPFDKQTCSIMIESFGYTANKLRLKWHPVSPVENTIRELRQFRLESTTYSNYSRNHTITGEHSCLQTDFHLVRNIGYYVIQMYIPSLLIVMLSWLSFWLNANSIPGRVTLGVLSVLTLSTQSSGVNASLPRVSYTKAIDVWMATCLVFAFLALIEFAVVNVLSSSRIMGRRFSLATLFVVQKDQEEKEIHLNTKADTMVDQSGKVSGIKNKAVMCSRYLDVSSRVLFPLAFTVFNLVYWIYYLNV